MTTVESDRPRRLRVGRTTGDRVFRGAARGVGVTVLLVMGGIGVFLTIEAIPAFREFGWGFFTTVEWNPESRELGIAAVLVGTITVATIAMLVAFPLALGTALYISQYAVPKAKRWLIAMIDLMASVPSVIYGLFGAYLLQPEMVYVSRWLQDMLGFIPIFQVDTDPDAAVFAQGRTGDMLQELGDCLRGHFDVEHSTFQLEPAGHSENEEPAHR